MAYGNFSSGASCAGIVATGVAGFFIGIVLFIYGIVNELDAPFGPDKPVFATLAVRATIIVWLGSWCWLYFSWRNHQVQHQLAHKVASMLIGIGVTASIFTLIREIMI
jgi:hypothetical protein